MPRPNTTRDDLNELLENLSYGDIEASIDDYLKADDRKAWMKAAQSGQSRRYFLIWHGEKLDAKAIAKGALKANNAEYENWHTDPIIDSLEELGFAVWDAQRDGEFDLEAATTYEITRRLARTGQQRFRSEALRVWGHKCAISGVSLDTALEAAHIAPHHKEGRMAASNSIVLRADLHRLFDTGLLAIEPKTLEVRLQPRAEEAYSDLKGCTIKLPKNGPSSTAFEERWHVFSCR